MELSYTLINGDLLIKKRMEQGMTFRQYVAEGQQIILIHQGIHGIESGC